MWFAAACLLFDSEPQKKKHNNPYVTPNKEESDFFLGEGVLKQLLVVG